MKTTTENLEQLLDLGFTIEDFTIELFMMWCESVTTTDREFQKVLSSPKISKWFLYEIAKHEAEYVMLISRYEKVSSDDEKRLFARCISKLFSHFPKALLAEAKKREAKPETTKIQGVKIEFSILNLN